MVTTRADDDELEASIWNLERAPSPSENDPIGHIRMAGSYSSPPPSVVGSPTAVAGRRFRLQTQRQIRSESNLSPILDRIRAASSATVIGTSSSSSPTLQQQQQQQQSQPQLTHRSSLPPLPLGLSPPSSPQSSTRWSQFFHGKSQDESNRLASVADMSTRQLSSQESIEGSSFGLDDSLASARSQHHPPPSHPRQFPSPISERMSQWNLGNDDDDDTYNDVDLSREDGRTSRSLNDVVTPVIFLGFALPLWCSKKPSWTQVSELVVRYAPCFICCSAQFHGTDRAILSRLNILNAIFALGQVGVAAWFAFIELANFVVPNREAEYGTRSHLNSFIPNLWNPSGSLISVGIIGFIILATNLIALRAIQEVNLLGAIRYLWVMLWMLPFEIYYTISLFDYHRVTDVWVRNWWNDPALAWFRFQSCAPNTANSLCTVPIDGGAKFDNETAWCEFYYHANNCTQIRDDAQTYTTTRILIIYYANAVWGIVMIVLLLLTVNTLERIISKPIVQKSRESNVPAWLTLPTIGCVGVGMILLCSNTSVLKKGDSNSTWIAYLYVVTGGLFLLAAALGWFISAFSILNSRDKRSKHLAVISFIVVTFSAAVILAIIFASSIIISVNLVNLSFTDSERAKIACSIDQGQTCSGCRNPKAPSRCMEWTADDVTKVLQTQLKQSATLAAIFIIYAFSAVRFGFVLRKHITIYQIDYV